MTSSDIKKRLVSHFLERGLLLTKEVLEKINDPNEASKLMESLEGDLIAKEKENQDVPPQTTQEGPSPQPESNSSPITESKIKILYTDSRKPEKTNVQDFVSHFKARYNQIAEMLKRRAELSAVLSISRVNTKKDREQVAIIGLVSSKGTTKNENIMLEVEDPTGTIKVVINKNKPDLYDLGKEICLDEVIGIVGAGAGEIMFANSVIQPDIPFTELKKSPTEEYAVFLSDMHVGSQCFLPEPFEKFLNWINGTSGTDEQKRIASKVKYLFIGGDLVAGVGIYPSQREELTHPDIYDQFKVCAEYLKKVPKHIEIVVCPGNHDPVRLAEPQPRLDENFARALYELPNITFVSNPAMVNFGQTEDFPGFNVLMYHGYSFIYYAENIERLRLAGGVDRADLLMQYLLKRRHLAPTHTAAQYMPYPDQDPLVITQIPDFFIAGHIHKASVATYKSVTTICGSCWESQTPFEAKLGLHPEPGRVPVVNLQTRKVKILRFYE